MKTIILLLAVAAICFLLLRVLSRNDVNKGKQRERQKRLKAKGVEKENADVVGCLGALLNVLSGTVAIILIIIIVAGLAFAFFMGYLSVSIQ